MVCVCVCVWCGVCACVCMCVCVCVIAVHCTDSLLCSPVPEQPTMLQGVASTNPAEFPSLNFTWLAPSVTNGEILDYRLTCVVPQGIPTPPDVTTPTTSAVISNLENGIQYCCTVSARNVFGCSLPMVAHCITTVEIGI